MDSITDPVTSDLHINKGQMLGLLFIGTNGINSPPSALGTDEADICLLHFNVIHSDNPKEVLYSIAKLLKNVEKNIDISEENNNEDLPDWKNELDINQDELCTNLPTLNEVISEIDSSLAPEIKSEIKLVTFGQHPLRQVLHPQASAKDIELPNYFYSFVDVSKYIEAQDRDIKSVALDLIENQETEETPDVSKLSGLTLIVHKLIRDGHNWTNSVELIMNKLEPGICSSTELVDGNAVVRARGLPWQSSDQDVAKFFRGLNIAKGGVALCLSPQGRRNGEALVRFINQSHRDMGLKRHKHHIGQRYIEVYKATGEDFISVAGGSNNEAQAFLSKGGQVIVRMRGLPYDCSPKQVVDFFETNPEEEIEGCKVLEGEEGVLFVKRPDGRATGDAFVLFQHEEEAVKALSKHKQSIGSRYIELFRSTTAEVQQVLNRCLEPKPPQQPPPPPQNIQPPSELHYTPPQQLSHPLLHHMPHHHQPHPHLHHQNILPHLLMPHPHLLHSPPPASRATPTGQSSPTLPQHIITSGTRKDCIRLRGLPYEAQVEHILEFLNEHAKNIVFQGVHMVYNSQGQPSGEAFIQMNSEQAAFHSAQSKHHHIMVHFKKQRYIEVFQCSGDDMNLVLTGGKLPSSPPLLHPQLQQLSQPHPLNLNQMPQNQMLQGMSGIYPSQYINNNARFPQQQIFYYYSPPISPANGFFQPAHGQHGQHNYPQQQQKKLPNDLLLTTANSQPDIESKYMQKRFNKYNLELGVFIA